MGSHFSGRHPLHSVDSVDSVVDTLDLKAIDGVNWFRQPLELSRRTVWSAKRIGQKLVDFAKVENGKYAEGLLEFTKAVRCSSGQ